MLVSHSKASAPEPEIEDIFFGDDGCAVICYAWGTPVVELPRQKQVQG